MCVNKNIFVYLSIFLVVVTGGILLMKQTNNNTVNEFNKIEAKVLSVSNTDLTIQDDENIIYTLELKCIAIEWKLRIVVVYMGKSR